jgi:hypothetical protein
MPELREAYYTGEIGLARVTQLIRVHQTWNLKAWVERARSVTVRRLELEVQAVVRRVDLIQSGVLPRVAREDPYAVLPEGTNIERYMSALEKALTGPAEVPAGAPAPLRRREPRKGPTVRVSFRMEPDAAEVFFDCVERCRAIEGRQIPLWQCLDRFMDAFFAANAVKDPRANAFNHKIMERDGWRCQVPGCRRRGVLHVHHIKHGPGERVDEGWNAITVCSFHHLHGIHWEGWLRVEGQAPDNLTWYMGKRADGQVVFVVGPGESIEPRPPRRRVNTLYPTWM